MKLWGILLACALVLSCARPQPDRVTPPQPAPPPSKTAESTREIRAVWVSNTDRLDWDGATRNLQRAGFNTMYVNFASGGAAFYPSQLVPEVPGSPDPSAGIALAHQRGIQVHGKLIVTFMFRTTPEFQRRLLAANRAMRGPDGKPIEQAGYYWLCPTQDSNRTLLGGIVNEMVTRYPVDGLQFDYIRFCEQPSCYCSHCKREFEKATGRAVTDTLPFKSWQQQQITSLVRELSTRAHAARPGLVVSSAVFPDLNRAKEEKAQDWQAWLTGRLLDYVCTMTYTQSRPEFESLIRQQQAWAGDSKRVVVGIGSWKMTDLSQVTDHIRVARQLNSAGFALFSYDDAEERNFLPVVSR